VMDFALDTDSSAECGSAQQSQQHLVKREHRRMDNP